MQNPFTIHEPNTLFTLPQPIDPTSGRSRASHVFGINGSRKRKRSEVVIGIDGECINVYNIKTPQLITTHALPPQTYLTAPPSCILKKSSGNTPSQRFVYAATRNGLAGKSSELLCFLEATNATSSDRAQRYVRNISAQLSDIVHVEPISSFASTTGQEQESHQVIAVHRNGEIAIFSEDLEVENGRGVVDSQTLQSEEYEVELVKIHSSSVAKNALLVQRPDLTARLEEADTVVLVVTSSKAESCSEKRQKTCHVLSIQSSRFGSTSQAAVRTLISWPLVVTDKSSQLVYQDDSASLYQLYEDHVVVWDLKSLKPRICSEFRIHSAGNQDLVPVSYSAVLVSSSSECILYDSTYGAVQATQRINPLNVASSSTKKRKRVDQRPHFPQVIPVGYFPAVGAAICLVGLDLVSLGITINTKGKMRPKESRLIDSLGRSRPVLSHDQSQLNLHGSEGVNAAQIYEKLRDMLSEQRLEEFDDIFIEFISNQSLQLTRNLTLRVMNLIFEWTQNSSPDLYTSSTHVSRVRLKHIPRVSLEWMADNGLLTAQNISKAIFASNDQGDGYPISLSESEMVTALAQADPSLNLLADLLNMLKLGISGYMESLRILMESFHAAPSQEQILTAEKAPQKELTNGITEQQILLEESAAAEELQLAAALLEGGFDGRGSALKTSIERLGTNFSSSELVQTLRDQLSHREIFMLMEILRIELDQAGWTSRRLDFHPSQDATENQNEAIAVICKLLNCALDAIGTGGWISRHASSNEDEIDSVIGLLRTDTNAVLEGVQEATFFSSFLKDFIRYEETLNEASNKSDRMKWSTNDPPQLSKSMLPLGLKSAQKPAATRVGAGGEIQKRSARQKAMESSRKIGKYKFETIRI